MKEASQINNIDQLRTAIDSGAMRDKVPAADPAAAPLGTDEEAAGTPVSRSALQHAFREETGGRANSKGEDGNVWALIAIVVVVVAAFGVFLAATAGRF